MVSTEGTQGTPHSSGTSLGTPWGDVWGLHMPGNGVTHSRGTCWEIHAGGTAVTGTTTSTACVKPGSKQTAPVESKHLLNTVLQHRQHGQYRTRGVQQQGQKLASVSVRMNKPHSENKDFH